MKYSSDSIMTVLRQLNYTYFLPAIQREFVWKPPQVYRLFDSIMQDYPIGSFLFWQLNADNRHQWDAYQFLTEFEQLGTHNPLANLAAVPNPVLVLDGQQRLTALSLGLKGHMKMYLKTNLPPEDPTAWENQFLYLNLLSDPSSDPDPKTGDQFLFRFRSRTRSTGVKGVRNPYWFEVARISACDSEERLYDLKRTEIEAAGKLLGTLTPQQTQTIDSNLDRLYRRVWSDESLAYHLVRTQDANKALEIFARANNGGTRLDKSDLMLAMVTARWDPLNAREEIYQLVEQINRGLPGKSKIDKDFVLKCALVLCDLPVAYRVEHFTRDNMQLIARKWTPIKQAINAGFALVKSFGIDGKSLTSVNALIPAIYYLMKHPEMRIGGTTAFDATNARAIRKWLAFAMLAKVFGSQTDAVLSNARAIMMNEQSRDFPLADIANKLDYAPERLSGVIVNRTLKLSYGQPLTFLALTLLYDEVDWGNRRYSIDHIFPQSLFTTAHLTAAGIHQSQHSRYKSLSQSLGNLLLLITEENMEKSNREFAKWIETRAAGFKQRHHIPEDASLYTLQRFPEFIKAREAVITKYLNSVFAS